MTETDQPYLVVAKAWAKTQKEVETIEAAIRTAVAFATKELRPEMTNSEILATYDGVVIEIFGKVVEKAPPTEGSA